MNDIAAARVAKELRELEKRMNTHQADDQRIHGEMNGKLDQVLELLGKPAHGEHPPTGLFFSVAEVGKRVEWFERLREWGKGALATAGVAIAIFVPILWFTTGHKLESLFGG